MTVPVPAGAGGVDDGGLGHDIAVKLAHRCDQAERRAASRCTRAEVRVDAQDLRAVLAALAAAEQRADTLAAANAKALKLHVPVPPTFTSSDRVSCPTCYDKRWPCPTFAALSSRPVQPEGKQR